MLILAGVVINLTMGDNGIIGKVQTAVGKYENAQIDEEALIAKISNSLNSNRDDNEEIALLKQEIAELKKTMVPVGTIISYYGDTAPTGYLPCDGSSHEVSKYEALAEFLGVDVDTEIIFKLPDLQGEFLRGAGTNSHTQNVAGVTVYEGSGAAVRTHQKATVFRNIWHGYGTDAGGTGVTLNFYSNSSSGTTSNLDFDDSADRKMVSSTHGTYMPNGFTKNSPNTSNFVAFSSRPTNTSVLYCIKY